VRIDDTIIAATSSSTGGICLLMMQLPPIPGASSADLQVRCSWLLLQHWQCDKPAQAQ
jgi:hypothetical protein